MKTLMAALLLVSFSSFANELDATDALLSTVQAGQYHGVTPSGANCHVSINDLSSKVLVKASSEGLSVKSEIPRGAHYRWNPGPRSFLSGSKGQVFRTIAVTANTQYIVVAEKIDIGRRSKEVKVECIVNL